MSFLDSRISNVSSPHEVLDDGLSHPVIGSQFIASADGQLTRVQTRTVIRQFPRILVIAIVEMADCTGPQPDAVGLAL